jgi:hypothetical protein
MDLQMARAKGAFAVPLKIFTLLIQVEKKNRRNRRMNLWNDCNNERTWRKPKLAFANGARTACPRVRSLHHADEPSALRFYLKLPSQ